MTSVTYFFKLWLRRLPSEYEMYFFVYSKDLSRKGNPDILALNALLALAED